MAVLYGEHYQAQGQYNTTQGQYYSTHSVSYGEHQKAQGQHYTSHHSIGYAILAWGEQSHRTTSSVMCPVLVGSVVATLTELYTEDW
jgi:hypothetical protein